MNKTIEELAAEERKEYFKAWRAANKEKTAEHRRRYWEKKALERLATERGEEHDDTDAGKNNREQ
ncbi:MAG: hypothetical protein LBG29_07465 [Synergistaceae bacterium]|nr:hypothetical protein [Synergistaceae bacterium]